MPLGLDFLTFLATTVLVIPLFKSVKASPILGFLFSGVVLGQLGLFRNITEIEKLSQLGVLFLLFEMGLELSLDRLKALAKYAFGLGLLQMLFTTAAFTVFSLPVGHGIGTVILEQVFHAPSALAAIRSVDEAVVIGVALSLSSSAFVLQLLAERGELTTKFGSATLGILLAQDIAVVPFLVLLPLVEQTDMTSSGAMDLINQLGPTALVTLGSLALLLLGGRIILRRVFEMVAESRSDETFVALCLLTVTGASLLTQRMGFSDTMGAFVAGVLLSETNYRSQVEADIRPFRSLLLGLFFVTTGSSMDLSLLFAQWPIVIALLGGLLSVKIGIIGTISQWFGLTKGEAIRTGFLLSQGGEFAFVLLSLAKELKVLPDELNRLLIIVVVLSMALTPFLAEFGKTMAEDADGKTLALASLDGQLTSDAFAATLAPLAESTETVEGAQTVVICGFGELGQTVANMLESPLAISAESSPVRYIGFDLQPSRIKAARLAGFNVTYGDGSRPSVIKAYGVKEPRAFAVVYTARARAISSVRNLRSGFPNTPIWARALDLRHAAELTEAGATSVITNNTESGTALGSSLLSGLGVARQSQLTYLTRALRKQMENRTIEMVAEKAAATNSTDADEKDIFDIFVMGILNKDELPSLSAVSDDEDDGPNAPMTSSTIDHEALVIKQEGTVDHAGFKQIQPEIPARKEKQLD